jgi:hypothetical protein
VVLAGQGGAAKFIQEERINTFRTVIYFRTEFLQVEGYGRFEAYSNRIRSNTAACMV